MKDASENTKKRNALLDRLEQESWQLELIVSGVIIFLLLGVYSSANELGYYASKLTISSSRIASVVTTAYSFLFVAYVALIGIFLFHLVLRGMWIGAIGLRSVSGDFDFEQLNYPGRYGKFLQRRLGSFDDYIERLERNASATFSLAFLLFFAILSLGLFFVVMVAGVLVFTLGDGNISSIDRERLGSTLVTIITIAVLLWVFLLLIFGLIYFIDFITFGWIKRRKWFGKLYYPFYRFMGWITLARLYRPFYYNIVDNRFGRKLVRVYASVTFVGMLASAIQLTPFANFAYAPYKVGVVSAVSYDDQYEETRINSTTFNSPSLGSRHADRDYLSVFVPLNEPRHDRVLKHRFPELSPLAPSSLGLMNKIRLGATLEQEKIDSTLRALSAIYRIKLNDSLITDLRWKFYDHPVREQPGLLYDLPVYDLPRGEYWTRFQLQRVRNDSLYWEDLGTISFLR